MNLLLFCKLDYFFQFRGTHGKITTGGSIGFVIIDADNSKTFQSAANIILSQIHHKGECKNNRQRISMRQCFVIKSSCLYKMVDDLQ